MRKSVLTVMVFILAFMPFRALHAQQGGEELFERAQASERLYDYTAAREFYSEARARFIEGGDREGADKCRLAMYRMEWLTVEYPVSEDDLRKALEADFSDVPAGKKDAWLVERPAESIMLDGGRVYFEGAVKNIYFRNIDLIRAKNEKEGQKIPFVTGIWGQVFPAEGSEPAEAWEPYTDAKHFHVTISADIPRKELPRSGILKVWMPLAIDTTGQTDVKVISITPGRFAKYPARTEGDIGAVYLEIPLEEITEDLKLAVEMEFKRYRAKFVVDPENAGEYDKTGYLYRKYTSSGPSVTVTPEITEKAKEIVRGETNPYRAAKKIYDHIVKNIPYSLMPHARLAAIGVSEAVFCNDNGYGDCGTQSIYFAALCRAVGIPARACGGYQLFPGVAGPHFWAEFYLPNYGWLPVDVTIAESSDWAYDLTDDQRAKYKEFFFGSLDNYRMTIQSDVDEPYMPKPDEEVAMPMVLQVPVGICKTSEADMGVILDKYCKFEIKEVE